MNEIIEIDEDFASLIDELRGDLSRDEYIDMLLKKHQGVTHSHPPESENETHPEK